MRAERIENQLKVFEIRLFCATLALVRYAHRHLESCAVSLKSGLHSLSVFFA